MSLSCSGSHHAECGILRKTHPTDCAEIINRCDARSKASEERDEEHSRHLLEDLTHHEVYEEIWGTRLGREPAFYQAFPEYAASLTWRDSERFSGAELKIRMRQGSTKRRYDYSMISRFFNNT